MSKTVARTRKAKKAPAKKMGAPLKEEPRDKQYTIRLLDEEKAAFQATAKARGLPMMTWARIVLRKESGLDP